MPRANEILSDQELEKITGPFQPGQYSKDRAVDLVAAMVIAMVSEPGDQMAGSLRRIFGSRFLVEMLINGFEQQQVISCIEQAGASVELSSAFGDLDQTIAESRQRWLPRVSKLELEQKFKHCQQMGLGLVLPDECNWPAGLDDLQDAAPGLLFTDGLNQVLADLNRAVSIVGSRNASAYGLTITEKLVAELAKTSRPTVSGGAVGIDAKVHSSSIERNLSTVAVMAGGLDRKYPRANLPLFDEIKLSGVVISELPPGVAPSRWRFLQRNRLIAALSPTTVVVEAALRSGSIRTANNALDMERTLYAVPGSLLSGVSSGTNLLIAEGKALALASPEMISGFSQTPSFFEDGYLAKRALDAIREGGAISKSDIAKIAGLTDFETRLAIQELEAGNQLTRCQGPEGLVHYALKYASHT
jgi:DNA processing protein